MKIVSEYITSTKRFDKKSEWQKHLKEKYQQECDDDFILISAPGGRT